MKLEFFYLPTADMGQSLAFYRDELGYTEAWREGDTTVALVVPGSEVQLMIDANDPDAAPGPVFVVDDVRAFHARRPAGLTEVAAPEEIPGGYLAVYTDPGGSTIQIMDQSLES